MRINKHILIIWPQGYATFCMLNPTDHDIYSASICKNANNCWHFNILCTFSEFGVFFYICIILTVDTVTQFNSWFPTAKRVFKDKSNADTRTVQIRMQVAS